MIHSSLNKYANGDFKDADSDLFGEKFKEELVKKVKADGALSKVVGIVLRSSKVYQTPQNQNKGKSSLFTTAEPAGMGLRSEGVKTRTQATAATTAATSKGNSHQASILQEGQCFRSARPQSQELHQAGRIRSYFHKWQQITQDK